MSSFVRRTQIRIMRKLGVMKYLDPITKEYRWPRMAPKVEEDNG